MEEVKRWIEIADRDLDTASYLYKGKKYEECAFFCQQAVEKFLKAIMIKMKKDIIKTHDLLVLAEILGLPVDLRENCKELTLIQVFARYPDTAEVSEIKTKAKKYISFAKKVKKWTNKQLSQN